MARSYPKAVRVSTDIPGVWRNQNGQMVDENGVLLSFKRLKEADDTRGTEVLGSVPTTPAELLKGIALDPRMHIDVRMSAARHAAPYFDQRLPFRLEGELNTKSSGGLDMGKVAAMPRKDRELLLKLLKAAGAEL